MLFYIISDSASLPEIPCLCINQKPRLQKNKFKSQRMHLKKVKSIMKEI